MSNSAVVSRKAEDAYPTDTPGPCSQFYGVRVAYLLLLLCIYDFSYFMFLLCMSVFSVWSLSLDYILLIAAITLVPLIILSHHWVDTSAGGFCP